MAKVVNISSKKLDDILVFSTERIDRTTPWGNPYIIGINGNRDDVCNRYKEWLSEWIISDREIIIKIGIHEYSNKWVIEHLYLLIGKDLACWCAPQQCHGDILLELVEELIKLLEK